MIHIRRASQAVALPYVVVVDVVSGLFSRLPRSAFSSPDNSRFMLGNMALARSSIR